MITDWTAESAVRILGSGDLLCTGGNPAYGLQPLIFQFQDSAGCPESFRLQSRHAVHVWTVSAVPGGIVSPTVIV